MGERRAAVLFASLGAIAVGALFAYGGVNLAARAMPAAHNAAPLAVTLVAEPTWWRLRYSGPDGATFETANELHVPRGTPLAVTLAGDPAVRVLDAPALGWRIAAGAPAQLAAPAEGVFAARCAGYCATADAPRTLTVVVHEPDAFAAWLANEAADFAYVDEPEPDHAEGGRDWGATMFRDYGCGGCHVVRGSPAEGTAGPDLTHVANRRALGASPAPSDIEGMARWIAGDRHRAVGGAPDPAVVSEEHLSFLAFYLHALH